MKPGKIEQIRRVRLAARQLHELEHVKSCACCQYDADAIETLADAPCTPAWLSHVAKRIADVGGATSDTPPRSP